MISKVVARLQRINHFRNINNFSSYDDFKNKNKEDRTSFFNKNKKANDKKAERK
jgi:hypothetical protein